MPPFLKELQLDVPLTVNALFSLAGRCAVVTGSAAGIGKATAMLLASAGATVVIADKDAARGASVARQLGGNHCFIPFDLENDSSIGTLFEKVNRRFGRCDILVNNAAIFPKYRFEELTEAQWHDMQRTNVWGCFVALREAARIMRESATGGRIINVSSIASLRTAVDHQLAYNASKAALDSITKSAALELAPYGILVNSICPGAVIPLEPKAPVVDDIPATGPLMDPQRNLIGRFSLAHEIAGPILMLASAAGASITGQCLVVDCGFSMS